MALSVGTLWGPLGVVSTKGGGRGHQGNRVSIQRPLLLLRKSYQLDCQLPPIPFRSLAVSQTILWWAGRGGTQQCPQVVRTCSWERRFWVGLFICHHLSKSWVSTYQSKRLVAMAGPSYVSKTFPQLTFSITIFKLVMCWNISLGCLQSVLRMHENCSIIFIIDAKTRPGVQAQFSDHDFDLSMLTLYCVLMKLSWDQDSENLFSQRHFSFMKYLPYIACLGI